MRELENCLERACALSSGPVLYVFDLPSPIRSAQQPASSNEARDKIIPMLEVEKKTILSTIEQLNGDKLLAAKLLGIGKTTLYRKLKEYASHE